MTDLVWYAAYGSNLSRERFRYYIEGGLPPGSQRPEPYSGCRNTEMPATDKASELEGALAFGKRSTSWQGCGVAFLEVEAPVMRARARIYLITHEQFEDVVAQENGKKKGDLQLPELVPGMEPHVLPAGFYPRVIVVGNEDGYSVATITDQSIEHRKPSSEYLHHVAQGLRESHHMSDYQIADYLKGRPGIVGAYEASELLSAVRSA